MSEVRIRRELPTDVAGVREVLAKAFPTDAEAKLVDTLRGATDPQISLVADDGNGRVIGHILFTPVEIRSALGLSRALALGPLGVHPESQRHGVGSALVRAGLSACREKGEPMVVVLGHPFYYPRFGFVPAWDFGLYYLAPGRNAAFMAVELEAGTLGGRTGEVCYHPAFRSL